MEKLIDIGLQVGLEEIKGSVLRGVPGLWIGDGVDGGFALIAGGVGPGVVRLGNGGCLVAVSLDERGLRALADRALTMLGDKPSSPPLPDGLVLG